MMFPGDDEITGDPRPELVPVVEPGAQGPLPLPIGQGEEHGLGDLLSDALLGEVIDISDLIPRVFSPSQSTHYFPSVEPVVAGPGALDASDFAVASGGAPALNILYDDDMLASDTAIR
ncbi:hypothetical protein [Mesorhizobium marinum]|uniref:Uncharacterized protein n=1 Tax=Mesorhizobium marinum TaxID=3228790 RepID=A0ABV3R5B4_9HYPH